MNKMNEGGKPQEPTTNLYGQAGTGFFSGCQEHFSCKLKALLAALKGHQWGPSANGLSVSISGRWQ